MEALIAAIGRTPFLRTTLYQPAPEERRAAAFAAAPVADVVNTPLRRKGAAVPGALPRAAERGDGLLRRLEPTFTVQGFVAEGKAGN